MSDERFENAFFVACFCPPGAFLLKPGVIKEPYPGPRPRQPLPSPCTGLLRGPHRSGVHKRALLCLLSDLAKVHPVLVCGAARGAPAWMDRACCILLLAVGTGPPPPLAVEHSAAIAVGCKRLFEFGLFQDVTLIG